MRERITKMKEERFAFLETTKWKFSKFKTKEIVSPFNYHHTNLKRIKDEFESVFYS